MWEAGLEDHVDFMSDSLPGGAEKRGPCIPEAAQQSAARHDGQSPEGQRHRESCWKRAPACTHGRAHCQDLDKASLPTQLTGPHAPQETLSLPEPCLHTAALPTCTPSPVLPAVP